MKDKETQLVLKAQQGNNKAFGKLVKKYQDKVLYLAYDMIGNYEDAKDIAQNAFFRAFRSIRNFKGKSSFSTWLFRIVINLSIDFKRAKSRNRQVSIEKPLDDSEQPLENILKDKHKQPDQLLELKDFSKHLEKAAEKLPHNQRVAFVLRNYHDMDMDEIAAILECKTGTVRSHLFRAIHKLREELKEFKTL